MPTPVNRRVLRLGAVATGAALIASALLATPAVAAPPRAVDPFHPDFGPNVTIYSPATPVAQIRSELDALHAQQVDAEMST
ncbi:MAG TPA: adenylyl cyclase, partial [Microbacterium sp.]|nr:adenylyl cyclase [Microbacterium sp.]